MGIFACSPWSGPTCIAIVGIPAPIKNCFLVCYSPVGLVNTSPTGYQRQVIQGPPPQSAAAKTGTAYVYTGSFWVDTGDLEQAR